MIVAGIMSGTSADGIDVAVARIFGCGYTTRFRLLAHEHFPYPPAVRRTLLSLMDAGSARVADLARMDFLLGELYARAVRAAMKRNSISRIALCGCHGQTLYHQGESRPYLGFPISCTWQSGEGAVLAARLGVPVVSDFRPADMAAGGKGAPLVPFLDYVAFRHSRRTRVLQNLGGIANLTLIPPRAKPQQVVAFDSGPGNMVIDACMEKLFAKPFDRDGRTAARGMVLDTVLSESLRHSYFRQKPPKTAGREQFGREFVAAFLRRCGRARKEDVIATATALTARSIGESLRRFRFPRARMDGADFILAGGGARNRALVEMLRAELEPMGAKVGFSDDFGVPSEAKEALAFALLAHQSWHRRPGNLPSATGARRPAVLGKISYA